MTGNRAPDPAELWAHPGREPRVDETAALVMAALESRLGSVDGVRVETPLFEGGLELDSIDFLDLLLELEDTCGKRLRGETLTAAAAASVGSLIAYVEALDPR